MASDAAAAAAPAAAAPTPAPPKRRGSYNCGRCGLPKKGHVCSVPGPSSSSGGGATAGEPQPPPPPQTTPRRALQFDDPVAAAAGPRGVVLDAVPLASMAPPRPPAQAAMAPPRPPAQAAMAPPPPRPPAEAAMAPPPPRPPALSARDKGKARVEEVMVDVEEEEELDGDGDNDVAFADDPPLPLVEVAAGLMVPGEALLEVLLRLPPSDVAAAARVSRGWQACARRVWEAADELRLHPFGIQPVIDLIKWCPALTSLVLVMHSDVDGGMLASVAFNCLNLQYLDIRMANGKANRITGDALSKFVSVRQSLSALVLEGCSSLGFLNISSSSLSTLWLSGLCSLTKAVMNCPNLNSLSLCFSEQNNDSTNLVALVDSLGRTCPNLRKINISSIWLCNEAVFALESANLRSLCMLNFQHSSRRTKITDAAVASIVRSYASLELLDLSGSGITDNGLWMISNALPNTLTTLLLATCPNITTNGVQVVVAQLPNLCILDCGNSICTQPEAGRSYYGDLAGGIRFCSKLPVHRKQQTTCQKLMIKHRTLMKLSLWSCSAIDALYVNCQELVDLNLNLCTNLHPERLLIQCPKLKDVYVHGCSDMLIGAVRNQVLNEFAAIEPWLPRKRLADGSKRVQVPHFMTEQLEEQEQWGRPRKSKCTVHLT